MRVCFSPNGKVLFGRGVDKTDPEKVIAGGINGYLPSIVAAKNSGRVGKKPLIVKALDRIDDQYDRDIIVSARDAQRIWEENRKTHFVEKNRVIVVN